MFNRASFDLDKKKSAELLASDNSLKERAVGVLVEAGKYNYAYQFTWLDTPVIQLPQDLFVTQEILFKTKPDVIIETGIAWGGSVLFHAGVLELIGNGRIIAIDQNLPEHIKSGIMSHPFSHRITLIEGDSTDSSIIERISNLINAQDKVGVFLDSNHTHIHVLNELRAYGPFVTKDQYLTVYATAIEHLPEPEIRTKPWGHGNNPLTAINAYLDETDKFEIDINYDKKLLCTFANRGRLICRRNN